jgi:sigma-B regulation protein RsbU (phosphoserine phosphatase)
VSIRWKLILAIGAPLLGLLAVLLSLDYARRSEAERGNTRNTLIGDTRNLAVIYDGEFRNMAQVAISTAAMLETLSSADTREYYTILKSAIDSNASIYGACCALEPGLGPTTKLSPEEGPVPDAGRRKLREPQGLFGPYIFRTKEGLRRMDVAEAYDYLDPKWEWYRKPRAGGGAFWTEPFYDKDAGDIVMVTFVAPMHREGKFIGTVNIDVDLSAFQQRAKADMGGQEGRELYIVSRNGTFIVAPVFAWVMNETLDDLEKRHPDPESIRRLKEDMLAGHAGVAEIRSIAPGHENLILAYEPMMSTGWSLAKSVTQDKYMESVNRELRKELMVGLGGIAGVLAIVVGMGTWLTRPVERLALAVRKLGSGDLTASAEGVRSKDEIGQLARTFNGMVSQLRSHVEALTRETEARQRVESELNIARAIQASMLPHDFPDSDQLAIYARSTPAKFVGGDFYDFFTGSDGVVSVVVADVSGKGVPAAMLMAVTRTLLRSVAADPQVAHCPAQILQRVNDQLVEENSEGMFVTLFLGRYDPATGLLTFANAGHPPPYIVNPKGEIRSLGLPTGTVLGVDSSFKMTKRVESLGPGDTLVLYSDGVTEGRSPTRELYGTARLESVLREWGDRSARGLCERVYDAVEAYQGGEDHQADDVTVMALNRKR